MATNRPAEISEDIYHRIYRLYKRKISNHTIAATLHLPVRTVISVTNRLDRAETTQTQSDNDKTTHTDSVPNNEYLDIYFYPKTRYAILDLVGILSDHYTEQLKSEIEKALSSSWKAVAIRMSDVQDISEAAATELLDGSKKFSALGRFFAILDPSPEIESAISTFQLESAIPVFGTERAFEDAAFTKKGKMFGRRGSQSSG